jgi:Flp pilus assembly protein TadB
MIIEGSVMDHSNDHAGVDGPSVAGWGVAALAGLIAGGLAVWLGGATGAAAGVIGLVTFGVYAVLLGKGCMELTVTADHGHGHDAGHH